MPDWNDQRLISALKEGGGQRELATQQLLEKNVYFVPTLSKKMGLDQEAVLDAYTDGLLLTIDHLISGRFQMKSKIATYLYQVVYNKCRDLKKKSTTKTVTLEDWMTELEPTSRGIIDKLLIDEEIAELHLYLDQLGEPCRQILIDWGYWGYRMDEIANRAGLDSAEQAKKKKYKCLQKLLAYFKRT